MAIILFNNARVSDKIAAALLAGSEQCVLLVVLGAFFLFSRFRFVDLFLCHSIRILLAGTCALLLVLLKEPSLMKRVAGHTAFPGAMNLFSLTVCATIVLLIFAFVERHLVGAVNNWMFRLPESQAAMQRLHTKLQETHSEPQLAAALEHGLKTTFELDAVHLVPIDRLQDSQWNAGINNLDMLELDRANVLCDGFQVCGVEFMIPVSSAAKVTHVLVISPGLARAGLVSQEVNHLRVAAARCGHRLDALSREREMVERWTREALLLQQLTEAELRALRAQINPHFLFNSLNVIANLIATEPTRAEDMTLRLARVFRYVLKHSGQPFASIREEMEFLRAYLAIEEARFGDRLRIEMDVAPEVAGHYIPSLILQPIVENSLKHGLGPKPGLGNLWIAACARNGNISLSIEDDGIGFAGSILRKNERGNLADCGRSSDGFGLNNVRERLRTIYHDHATLRLEAREAGGSRVIILIPRDRAAAKV